MTKERLETEISGIAGALKKQGKRQLAKCIEENWDKTASEYSSELNTYQAGKGVEKELLIAFEKELERLGTTDNLKHKILASLQKRRVLQTAPHLGVTEGPRMFCINWLASLSVPKTEYYVVGMFSGIPFSNRSRPGRINGRGEGINLFGSNMQDGLVYRSVIPEKLLQSVAGLPEKLKEFFPKAVVGDSYTRWALLGCANIERHILKNKNLVYLDINEVVAKYLVQVLKNKNHIIYKIFFEPETRKEFVRIFPNEIMFYSASSDGKYEKMKNITFADLGNLKNSQDLIKELEEKRFCPALIIGFLTLAFLNEFKCLGSFAQVEYLPVYQEKLAKLKCMKNRNIKKVPTANLTTGVSDQNIDLYPVDIILGEKWQIDEKILFGELLLPIKKTLLESYFTGDERRK